MNDAIASEDITTRCGRDSGRLRAVRSTRRAFRASLPVNDFAPTGEQGRKLLRAYAPSSRRASTDCMSLRPSAIR